jgi:Na+/melibiose symporter-like transporter
LVYAVVLVSTGVSQFFGPAQFTLLGDIISGDADRAKAAGYTQSASYAASIIGPPLAAPLLFTAGVYWALIINALSFLASFALVRSIQVPSIQVRSVQVPSIASAPAIEPEVAGVGEIPVTAAAEIEAIAADVEPTGFLRQFTAGFRFVAGNRTLRILLIAVTVATFGAGALNALDLFFVTDNLHVSAHWYGTLGMGEGIGAIIGTIFAAWVCKRLGDTKVFSLGLIAVGVGLMVYSRLDNLISAILVLTILALPLGAINVATTPILLRSVPRDMLGRTISVFGPLQQLAGMISALAAGWLVSTVLLNFHRSVAGVGFGPIDVVFAVCGLIVAAGGLYAMVGLRNSGAAPSGGPDAIITSPVEASTS